MSNSIYKLKVVSTTLALIKCGISLVLLVKSENLKENYKFGNFERKP